MQSFQEFFVILRTYQLMILYVMLENNLDTRSDKDLLAEVYDMLLQELHFYPVTDDTEVVIVAEDVNR